jgi:hypothetical protein
MLRWAVDREYLDHSPVEGMAKPAGGKPRERVLSDDEIATLCKVLPVALKRIIRLCLLTGQRVGEVAGMTRGELDLKAREWRLPSRRTKNKRPHTVPLSDMAIGVINDAIADAGGGEFLFPCGAGHLSGAAVSRTIVRAHETDDDRPLGRFGIAHWSAHDLRRTCLDGLSRLGVAPHVIGAVANHRSVTKATVTFQHYVNYDYAREKRDALNLWADRLGAIVDGKAGAAVVPLRGALLKSPGPAGRDAPWGRVEDVVRRLDVDADEVSVTSCLGSRSKLLSELQLVREWTTRVHSNRNPTAKGIAGFLKKALADIESARQAIGWCRPSRHRLQRRRRAIQPDSWRLPFRRRQITEHVND